MFQFPTFPIHESPDICSSSWLFAAYHVLLRLLVPRHSPYALSSLTSLLKSIGSYPKIFLLASSSYLFIYIFFNVLGGAEESRTPDLLLARQAL